MAYNMVNSELLHLRTVAVDILYSFMYEYCMIVYKFLLTIILVVSFNVNFSYSIKCILCAIDFPNFVLTEGVDYLYITSTNLLATFT